MHRLVVKIFVVLCYAVLAYSQDVDICCTHTMKGSTFPCCDSGNCTWWAAYKCPEMNVVCAHKNAQDWYSTAQAALVEVGSIPARCGVVCFTTNHVAYVETVKASSIVISEMMCNIKGVNCDRQREIALPSSTIKGYIYPATDGVTIWDFKDRTLGWRIRANCTQADFYPPTNGDWWRLNPTGVQPQIYSPYSKSPIPATYKYLEIRYSVKGSGETVPCRAYFDTGSGAWESFSVKSVVRNNNPQTISFEIPTAAIGRTLRVLLDLFDVSKITGGVYQDDQISINSISFREIPTTTRYSPADWNRVYHSGMRVATFDIYGRAIQKSSHTASGLIVMVYPTGAKILSIK
jgi:hypothetical protein